MTLAQLYEGIQKAEQEKVAEDTSFADAIARDMDIGVRLACEFFPTKEAAAQAVVRAGSSLLRRIAVPVAAAGGAGTAGYVAGETKGEEAGARKERIRQIMEQIWGVDLGAG